MNQDSRNGLSQERGTGRLLTGLWKRGVLFAAAVIMVVGMTGCALDDLNNGYVGEVPFEQEQTPSEMDTPEKTPTVADDAAFDDLDFPPLN